MKPNNHKPDFPPPPKASRAYELEVMEEEGLSQQDLDQDPLVKKTVEETAKSRWRVAALEVKQWRFDRDDLNVEIAVAKRFSNYKNQLRALQQNGSNDR